MLLEKIRAKVGQAWVLRGALLYGEQPVWIVIQDGLTKEVIPPDQARAMLDLIDLDYVQCEGLIAVPALVDTHCHSRIMGQEEKEDEKSIVLAAEYGGVCIIGDMPNNKIPTTTVEALEEKIRRFSSCTNVEVKFFFGATRDNIVEYHALGQYYRQAILGIKVYLGSSTGDLMVDQLEDQLKVFTAAEREKILVAAHCEDEAMMREKYGMIKARKGVVMVSDHCQVRDTEVEVSAVQRALELQRRTGVRLLLCHLSSPEAVELAKEAKDAGQEVYVEVCPHHLFFDDGFMTGPMGPFYKMNPPLRSVIQVGRLRQLVCRPDFVDTIATDHAPHMETEKLIGDYDKTPSGVTGLETLLSVMWDFVRSGDMSIDRFISLTSRRAAEIFGLNAGRIESGAPANIILINPHKKVTWSNSMIHSKCGWTPFSGHTFEGDIEYFVNRGICKQIIR